MKCVVKIVSGYSDKGGSTTAFINLTNFFNDNGIDCTFFFKKSNNRIELIYINFKNVSLKLIH